MFRQAVRPLEHLSIHFYWSPLRTEKQSLLPLQQFNIAYLPYYPHFLANMFMDEMTVLRPEFHSLYNLRMSLKRASALKL